MAVELMQALRKRRVVAGTHPRLMQFGMRRRLRKVGTNILEAISPLQYGYPLPDQLNYSGVRFVPRYSSALTDPS